MGETYLVIRVKGDCPVLPSFVVGLGGKFQFLLASVIRGHNRARKNISYVCVWLIAYSLRHRFPHFTLEKPCRAMLPCPCLPRSSHASFGHVTSDFDFLPV